MLCSNGFIIGVKQADHLTVCLVRVILAIVDAITPTVNVYTGSIIAGELLPVLACGQCEVEATAAVDATFGVFDGPDLPSYGCV